MKFVDRHIESIEQLEVLLILAESDQAWTAAQILQNIQSSAASIELRLATLKKAGLISQSGAEYRFSPADEATAQTVRDLADSYRERRVRIIEAIYAPKQNAVQTFADAFRFKRKE